MFKVPCLRLSVSFDDGFLLFIPFLLSALLLKFISFLMKFLAKCDWVVVHHTEFSFCPVPIWGWKIYQSAAAGFVLWSTQSNFVPIKGFCLSYEGWKRPSWVVLNKWSLSAIFHLAKWRFYLPDSTQSEVTRNMILAFFYLP
jgi:hypothetical protein